MVPQVFSAGILIFTKTLGDGSSFKVLIALAIMRQWKLPLASFRTNGLSHIVVSMPRHQRINHV